MKTTRIINKKAVLGLLLISITILSNCQQQIIENTTNEYPTELPKNLVLDNSIPQIYKFNLHWINRDLDGNMINNSTVIAEYTRGLEDNSVKWDNVINTYLIDSIKYEKQLTELNGLTYKIIGDNFTKQDFYKDFPKGNIDLIRWFVQDAVGLEAFAWMYFDSLKLNQILYPEFFRKQKAIFENYGSFTNQDLSLCWTGISKRNNEKCAVIHYQAMYNPFDTNTDAMQLQGRSTYWGDIWISLSDKQIEYAIGNEDVVLKMKTEKYGEQRIDLQREVIFEKIN